MNTKQQKALARMETIRRAVPTLPTFILAELLHLNAGGRVSSHPNDLRPEVN
jgi:hypothetical protein